MKTILPKPAEVLGWSYFGVSKSYMSWFFLEDFDPNFFPVFT